MTKRTFSRNHYYVNEFLMGVVGFCLITTVAFADGDITGSMSLVSIEPFSTTDYQLKVMQGNLEGSLEDQKILFINRSDIEVKLRLPDGTIRHVLTPGMGVSLGSSPQSAIVIQINVEDGDLTQKIDVAPAQVIYFEQPGVVHHMEVKPAQR